MCTQVKSKERVKNHAEVFTAEREVNAMLDLVKDESYRIESKFLEPACGDGNFLIKILERKIEVVVKNFKKNTVPYEKAILTSVMSCYGIEFLEDNCNDCRKRLYKYASSFVSNKEVKKCIEYIIKRNIVHGDALTMKQNNGNPLVFSEWSFLMSKVKRIEYAYDTLIDEGLFSLTDDEGNHLITKPVKTYPLTDYRCLYEQ